MKYSQTARAIWNQNFIKFYPEMHRMKSLALHHAVLQANVNAFVSTYPVRMQPCVAYIATWHTIFLILQQVPRHAMLTFVLTTFKYLYKYFNYYMLIFDWLLIYS